MPPLSSASCRTIRPLLHPRVASYTGIQKQTSLSIRGIETAAFGESALSISQSCRSPLPLSVSADVQGESILCASISLSGVPLSVEFDRQKQIFIVKMTSDDSELARRREAWLRSPRLRCTNPGRWVCSPSRRAALPGGFGYFTRRPCPSESGSLSPLTPFLIARTILRITAEHDDDVSWYWEEYLHPDDRLLNFATSTLPAVLLATG
jgi:hypothetical protein